MDEVKIVAMDEVIEAISNIRYYENGKKVSIEPWIMDRIKATLDKIPGLEISVNGVVIDGPISRY